MTIEDREKRKEVFFCLDGDEEGVDLRGRREEDQEPKGGQRVTILACSTVILPTLSFILCLFLHKICSPKVFVL